jgi:hypothetical protein
VLACVHRASCRQNLGEQETDDVHGKSWSATTRPALSAEALILQASSDPAATCRDDAKKATIVAVNASVADFSSAA